MTASRKLYVAVAAQLKNHRPPSDGSELMLWRRMAWSVSQALWEDGTSFDRNRFLRASGFTDDDMMRYSHMF